MKALVSKKGRKRNLIGIYESRCDAVDELGRIFDEKCDTCDKVVLERDRLIYKHRGRKTIIKIENHTASGSTSA